MKFKMGAFEVTLNMSSFWDARKNGYTNPAAVIGTNFNRRYGALPADPKILSEFADWLKILAKAIEGAPSRDADRTDTNVDEAKRLIAKLSKA